MSGVYHCLIISISAWISLRLGNQMGLGGEIIAMSGVIPLTAVVLCLRRIPTKKANCQAILLYEKYLQQAKKDPLQQNRNGHERLEALAKLQQLKDSGTLTQEEFDAEKRGILDR